MLRSFPQGLAGKQLTSDEHTHTPGLMSFWKVNMSPIRHDNHQIELRAGKK